MTGIEETLAIGSLVAGVASAAIGTMGALNSASASSANANYQAQIAKNNQITAEQNAEYATKAGQEKAAETSLKAREQQGEVTTALAASGLDIDTGSPADIRKTQRETGVLSTEQVVDAAALQAYGYRTNSASFGAEAQLDQAKAAQALSAGNWAATGTLLGGASSVGVNYTKLKNIGALGGSSSSGTGFLATDNS